MIGEHDRNTLSTRPTTTCYVSFAVEVHSNCSLWDSTAHKSKEKMQQQDFNIIIDNNNKTTYPITIPLTPAEA